MEKNFTTQENKSVSEIEIELLSFSVALEMQKLRK